MIQERRLHPAYLLITLGRSVRSLIPLIAVGIWKAPGWSVLTVAGLLLLHAGALWWLRRYSVADGSLRVQGGLFNRTDDSIGIARISAVDAERGVLQRMLGVWGVRIRTPGNDHRSAIHLASLSGSAVEQLRAALRQPAAAPDEPTPSAVATTMAPEVLAVLDRRTLLLAAVTGTSVPLILAGAAATFGRAHDLLPERTFHRLADTVFVGGPATVLLLVAAALLAVLAGITLTSLRLAGFTLTREGDRLRIRRGLLAQRSGTIPVSRVQAVRIVEGTWRRLLGYCALEVEVAGMSSSTDTERMLFPLVRTASAADLVHRALPELKWTPTPLRRVPSRARRRYRTLPVLVAIPVAAGAAALPGWAALSAVLPIAVGLLVGGAQAADAAWSIDQATVTVRYRRVLARHTVVARRQRVQLTRASSTPFQRRADLAGVTLGLSVRRRIRIRHLAAADALLLLHIVGRPTAGPSTMGSSAQSLASDVAGPPCHVP